MIKKFLCIISTMMFLFAVSIFAEDSEVSAILHPIRNGLIEGYQNKYMLVGFDTKGNPIEIGYNRIDEEHINVFHVMKCRKEYLKDI